MAVRALAVFLLVISIQIPTLVVGDYAVRDNYQFIEPSVPTGEGAIEPNVQACEARCDASSLCKGFTYFAGQWCATYSDMHPTMGENSNAVSKISSSYFDLNRVAGFSVGLRFHAVSEWFYLCANPGDSIGSVVDVRAYPGDFILDIHPECKWIVKTADNGSHLFENLFYRGYHLFINNPMLLFYTNYPSGFFADEDYVLMEFNVSTTTFEPDASGDFFIPHFHLSPSFEWFDIGIKEDAEIFDVATSADPGARWRLVMSKYEDSYQLVASLENDSSDPVADMTYTLTTGVTTASSLGQTTSDSSEEEQTKSLEVELKTTLKVLGREIGSYGEKRGSAWSRGVSHESEWSSTASQSFSQLSQIEISVPVKTGYRVNVYQLVGYFDGKLARSPTYYLEEELI